MVAAVPKKKKPTKGLDPAAAAVVSAVSAAAAPAVVSAVAAAAAAVGGAAAVTGAVDRHYVPCQCKISLPVIKISKKKKKESIYIYKIAPRTRDICVSSPPFLSQDPAVTVAPACW